MYICLTFYEIKIYNYLYKYNTQRKKNKRKILLNKNLYKNFQFSTKFRHFKKISSQSLEASYISYRPLYVATSPVYFNTINLGIDYILKCSVKYAILSSLKGNARKGIGMKKALKSSFCLS